MGMSRDDNVDNGKRGPAGNYSKQSASVRAEWPYNMGAWDPPGFKIVTDVEPDDDTDYGMYVDTGKVAYNPVPGPET